MSRSRSRMDWTPASRSISRPPGTFLQDGLPVPADDRLPFPKLEPEGSRHIAFPTSEAVRYDERTDGGARPSSSIPIPRATSSPSSSFPIHRPPFLDHPPPDLSLDPSFDFPSHSRFVSDPDTAGFTSASLPSYNLPTFSLNRPPPPEHRAFPRHVRKTSFDHTVARDGIFTGLSGRHQVDGKPLSPDSLSLKRRADAPHAESMLRADPPTVDGPLPYVSHVHQETERIEHETQFPSAAFDFSYPRYETLLPYHGSGGGESVVTQPDYLLGLGPSSDEPRTSEYRQSSSASSCLEQNGNPGLSAVAAAASATVAETYAQQLNAANLEDPAALGYGRYMNLVYGGVDDGSNLSQNPYTHVDPTQILPADHGDAFQTFHASPSSDGWGSGIHSGATASPASPEPYNTSSASTPPSIEGSLNTHNNNNVTTTRTPSRPFSTAKRVTQDVQRRKSLSTGNAVVAAKAETMPVKTPDLADFTGPAKIAGEEGGDQAPTVCTNCQTSNTPLWRRDPEGQPLCAFSCLLFFFKKISPVLGNACGLFYVCYLISDVTPCLLIFFFFCRSCMG
jgi:GATA-binding protein